MAMSGLDIFTPNARKPTSALPLDDDAQAEFEERAAVLEFDGGYSRAEAERRALWEIARRK